MALHHLNLILSTWLSLSLLGGLISYGLRFPHHGRHCLLQLVVGMKLIEVFVATEKKKNTREGERKGFVVKQISLEVSQERGRWAWRERRQIKCRALPEREGITQKGEVPATELQ